MLDVMLQNWSVADQTLYATGETFVCTLAKVGNVTWLDAGAESPESATALVGEMQILILNNPAFADKAPAAVLEQTRKQADEQRAALEQL